MTDELEEKELLERLERIVKPAMCHLKYWTKKDEQAVQQIKERIQKPQVTEEWIEEKAAEIYNLSYYKSFKLEQIVDCIRSLVRELADLKGGKNGR